MRSAKLTDVKNHLSRYVERVRRGETVRILVRGVPAADLVPIVGAPGGETADSERLAALERRGWIRRGRGRVREALLEPGPAVEGAPLSALILDERRGGR